MKLTQIDAIETHRYSFDEQSNAHRVSIVGTDVQLSADFSKTNSLLEQLVVAATAPQLTKTEVEYKTIEIPKVVTEQVIKEIQVPTIITQIEYKEIEIPKIIIQETIREVEKPVYIEKIQIHTVEVPSQASFPPWLKLCMLAQATAIIGILLVNIFKH